MVQIKTQTANRSNYGAMRLLSKVLWIVIHYTANDGDHDEGNGSYFASRIVKASAHYFVDDDSITQSVPDDYAAYSVGGNKYNTAGGRLYGTVTNSNSLNIELCDTVKDGVIYPSQATIENALELVRSLMKKYSIPQDHVIRHWDVNGKPCPAYWTDDAAWKSAFWDRIPEKPKTAAEKGEWKLEDTKMKDLKSGSTGKAVKIWQVIVGAEVNGVFDVETEKKTVKWKTAHGWKEPHGYVKSKAWRVAFEELDTKYTKK